MASRPKDAVLNKYKNALFILKKCEDFFETEPNRLNLEGLLRTSSTQKRIDSLVKTILKKKEIPASFKDSHAVVGAMKNAMKNIAECSSFVSVDIVDEYLKKSQDPETQKAHQDFFESLMKGTLTDMYFAEILYIFHHVAYQVAQHQAENKMTEKNCAIILAPNILHTMNLTMGKEMVCLKFVQGIVEASLKTDYFALPFSKQTMFSSEGYKEKKDEALQKYLSSLEKPNKRKEGLFYGRGMRKPKMFQKDSIAECLSGLNADDIGQSYRVNRANSSSHFKKMIMLFKNVGSRVRGKNARRNRQLKYLIEAVKYEKANKDAKGACLYSVAQAIINEIDKEHNVFSSGMRKLCEEIKEGITEKGVSLPDNDKQKNFFESLKLKCNEQSSKTSSFKKYK